MNTFLLLLSFIGSYLLINSSKKAILRTGWGENWMQENNKQSQVFGITCLLLILIIAICIKGFTAGFFYSLFIIMTMLSLMILFNPIKKVNYKVVVLLFIISFLLELIFS